jgi:hypothetical protein
VAAPLESAAARARVKTRDTRFMAKPFKGRPGTVAYQLRNAGGPTL